MLYNIFTNCYNLCDSVTKAEAPEYDVIVLFSHNSLSNWILYIPFWPNLISSHLIWSGVISYDIMSALFITNALMWSHYAISSLFLGLGLFQNMFHDLLIYANTFCFGYIALSCFFETFLGGWLAGGGWMVVGKSDDNKTQSSVWTLILTYDFDLGFVKKLLILVCTVWK